MKMTKKTPHKTKPVSGTHEWSDYSANIQNGCENDCAYCYAKSMAIRFKRATAESWQVPQIRSADVEKNYSRRDGIIMFPTSHDITPANINECVTVLKKMLAAGNRVLIVSKPVPECVERLCKELVEYKKQILFRFTIGSANNKVLQYWEPGAPSFKARLKSLTIAGDHGFQTSVSSEPMMDNEIEAVVETVLPLITNAIWIGLPNRLQTIVSLNGGDDEMKARARVLVDGFTKERIMELYETYKDNPKVKWKESIKKVIGIKVPTKPGLDI